jgi:DNA-binding IclR family transcriptional regulator
MVQKNSLEVYCIAMRGSPVPPPPGAPARTKELSRHIDAVCRALDILDCFQVRPSFTLAEMAARTGLTRNRATRLAGTLESRGYLRYEADNGGYRLGSRLLTLGKIFEATTSLIALARPVLRELVRLTGEMASLYIRDGVERVALARERGTHEISYQVEEGQRMELYAGAAGKILLAYAGPEIRTRALDPRRLKRLTDTTESDPARLVRELDGIRRSGVAASEGERVAGVWSAAAPVFDCNCQVCAALGITGPSYRIPKRARSRYQVLVREKARELSRHLGWQEVA